MSDQIVVTRASDWKLKNTFVFQLPSGFVVRIRPVDLHLLLKLDLVPDILSQDIEAMINRAVVKQEPQSMTDIIRRNRLFLEAVAKACMVEPVVVDNPDYEKNQISPNDISTEDLEFLGGLYNKPALELRRFSEEQAQGLESVSIGVDDSQSPSELMRVSEWAESITGMPDWWTAYQFDNAVCYFGNYIENKASELNPNGKPLYQLDDLLRDDEPKKSNIDEAQEFFANRARGGFIIEKS